MHMKTLMHSLVYWITQMAEGKVATTPKGVLGKGLSM